jgi:hypothetical protein
VTATFSYDEPLPPAVPPVIPAPAPAPELEAAPVVEPAPRVVARQRESILRPEVLALVLCALVVVAVTLLAARNQAIPDVLATIGLVALGAGAGVAVPGLRKP